MNSDQNDKVRLGEDPTNFNEVNKEGKTSGSDDDYEDCEDDDIPQLPADTLAALQEFYDEQETIRKLFEKTNTVDEADLEEKDKEKDEATKQELFKIDLNKTFPEDWQLSQFWYDEDTSNKLAEEVLKLAGSTGTVACVSCPSIFRACKNAPNVFLFEYDKRFKAFGPSYHFYDYNKPEDIPQSCLASFSVVVADPPFLSEECLEKVAVTVQKILKENGKIILCTGAVMEPVASRLLNLRRSSFEPKHKNNLGNEFACFTNYDMDLTSDPDCKNAPSSSVAKS